MAVSGGPLDAVNPRDPSAGLVALGYYGDLWHVPFTPPQIAGDPGSWGREFTYIIINANVYCYIIISIYYASILC